MVIFPNKKITIRKVLLPQNKKGTQCQANAVMLTRCQKLLPFVCETIITHNFPFVNTEETSHLQNAGKRV